MKTRSTLIPKSDMASAWCFIGLVTHGSSTWGYYGLVAFGRYASILWFRTSFTHWEAVIVCYPLGHSILLTNCSIWTNNFDLSYFFASEPKNLVFFRPVNVLSQLCFLIPSGNRASTWYTKLDYATFLLWSFIDQKPFGVLLVLPSPWK